jgi:hypothetical protein
VHLRCPQIGLEQRQLHGGEIQRGLCRGNGVRQA